MGAIFQSLGRTIIAGIVTPGRISDRVRDAYEKHLFGSATLQDLPDAPRVEGFPGETFRVLKDRENRQYGEFRTARLVMAAWDALAKAGWDPSRYASPLAVPPGDARARHAG